MKKHFAFLILAIAAVLANVIYAQNFITPEMMYRDGLTDAQYQRLWSLGRSPQIPPNVARDWVFRASRYENTTNWAGIVGRSNDFARLSVELETQRQKLAATNGILKTLVGDLRSEKKAVEILRDRAEARAEEIQAALGSASNEIARITAVWTSDKSKAERAEQLRTWLESQRDAAKLTTTKKIYQAILDRL